MNNLDTVTLEVGDTQAHNRLLHTKEPFNRDSNNVDLKTSGRRAAIAQEAYQNRLISPTSGSGIN
jgi:hypothetical protein